MHRAPWTNTSSSQPRPAQAAISSRDISRASTTRVKPQSRSSSTPAGVWQESWGEACRGMDGAAARIRRASPMSWIISASTPRAQASSAAAMASGSSSCRTRVFRARCTRTFRA